MRPDTLLCRLEALPDGGARGVDPGRSGRDTVILVRQGERVHGWKDACPHYGDTPMAWRKDAYLSADGRHLVCYAHGAQFDIQTGRCTLGPCLGQSLTPVALIRRADGEIHLASEPSPETPT
jgi:nitrite reductase/ring-hydroxylating ferredoxin subunit